MEFNKNKQLQHCSLCDFKCTAKQQFQRHIQEHTHEKPFICVQCNRAFSRKSHLDLHIRRVHQKIEDFKKEKCPFCPYGTYWKSQLPRHMTKHTVERKFPCTSPGCNYAAKTSGDLRHHNFNKHTDERKFPCKIPNCGFRGKTMRALRLHSESHSDYQPFVCDFEGCSYRAKRRDTLKNHKVIVHGDGSKPFACSMCDYRGASKINLKCHQRTHAEEKSIKCDFSGCSFSCKYNQILKSHVLHCHTKKKVKCDFVGCSYSAATRYLLKLHKNSTHSKCPHCNYRAANLWILHAHMDHHHNTRIPCTRKGCTFQAKNPLSLKKHIRQHEQNLVCPVDGCGYVWFSSPGWTRHMTTHDPTGRPFHCPLCPKHYVTSTCLSRHLQKHTREKLFRCPLCDYGSVDKTRMAEHVRSVHSAIFPQFVCVEKATCNHCGVNFGTAVSLARHRMKLQTAVVVLTRIQIKMGT